MGEERMTFRNGVAEATSMLFIILMVIIMALVATVYVQERRVESRDNTIETMKQEKVSNKAKSDNKIFEVEHETIGKSIKGLNSTIEVNTSTGTHTIHFRGLH